MTTPPAPRPRSKVWFWLIGSVVVPIVIVLCQPIALRLAPTPVLVDCTAYVGLSNLQVSHPQLDEDRISLAFDERTIDVCGSPVENLAHPRAGART